MRFYQYHTSHLSHTWLCRTHETQLRCQQMLTYPWQSHTSYMRPSCDCERPIRLTWQSHSAISCVTASMLCNLNETHGGLASARRRVIGFRNLCYFLRNKDSRYCFLSCNRCSWMFNKGHLLIFKAYLVFLHLSSNIRSIAANILMVIS